MFYVDVSVSLPVDAFFTYQVPEELNEQIAVGKRVEVPFRRSKKTGLITAVHKKKPDFKTHSIIRVLDPVSILPSYAFEIAQWIRDFYGASLNEALHLFVPSGIIPKPFKSITRKSHPFYPLNPEQQEVYEAISANLDRFYPCLLFGVTGSGKTEVYRHLVKEVVEAGKQVIILVPEISLTPQTIERFASLFGEEHISVINSRLTPSNKLNNYYRIANRETSIVLGPRSALFTPMQNPGLIIIDEEQEYSYKSSESPRYHTRQVAFQIARHQNIPLLLGTATPSLETFHAAKTGKIHFFKLSKRHAGIKMPDVRLIDMKKERGTFSKELVQKIFTYQKSGYQSILFINRRGFSPVIQCTKCGYRFQCPNCSVSLTYHKKDNLFSCHYCGYEVLNPGQCAQCGESELIMTGSGTQRLEEEIQGIFHQFKIIRMDRDSTSKKGSHDQFLGDFRDGKADILVGTQMIAKGLDFEKVRIVGVVSADITLNLPDFRSGENAFSLLTQVAGRSGRKMPGEVVIQTFAPDHYVMQKVKQQDYEGFYNKEIEVRKNFGYPPFVRIVRLVIRGIQQEKVEKTAGKLAMDLKGKGVSFFGPAPCPLEKINKNFRYHLFIKTGKVIPLVKILKKTLETYQKISGIYIELDVDPVSML